MALAHPRLRAKRDALRAALPGHVRPHHRVLLHQHLRVVETLQATIAELDAAIGAALVPCRATVAHLVTIPGVSTTAAQILVAEIGTDMTRFPSAGHPIFWAGLWPRQDASAGKHRSTRLRKGAPWLKPVLIQGAWAAVRGREGYRRAQFLRLKQRREPMKAIVAVAASMLTAAYPCSATTRTITTSRRVFFTNLEDVDKTVAIDLKTRSVSATWKPACGEDGPKGLALDHAANVLFVACPDRVVALDAANGGRKLTSIDVRPGIDTIDYDESRHELFAAAGKAATLAIAKFDPPSTLTVFLTVLTAAGARNAVAGDDGVAWLTNSREGKILRVTR